MPQPIRNVRLSLPPGQLFWREVGRGSALVFLHDSWSDGSEWLPVMEQLGHDFHCFAPDLLGFGESERPKIHYSIEVEVECLAAYLDSLKLRRVYLIGQGLGGWVAASYAVRYPHQVEGLVLLRAEGLAVRGRPYRRYWWLTHVPLLGWMLRSLSPLARWVGLGDRAQSLLQEIRQLKRHPVACQLLFNRRKAEIQAELMGDRLPWLKTPVLILQGEEEDRVSTRLNQGYAQAPYATVHHHPGGDLVQTSAAIVAQDIRAFIKSL